MAKEVDAYKPVLREILEREVILAQRIAVLQNLLLGLSISLGRSVDVASIERKAAAQAAEDRKGLASTFPGLFA